MAAQFEALIVGPWQHLDSDPRKGGHPTNRPLIGVVYNLDAHEDITAQPGLNIPTAPNLVAHRIVAQVSVIVLIKQDARFHLVSLRRLAGDVSPEDPPEQQPELEMLDAEFASLRAYLMSKSIPTAEVDKAVGPTKAARTRRQIIDTLRPWLRDLPRAFAS